MRCVIRAESVAQEFVTVISEAGGNAARAAHVQRDSFWFSFVNDTTQRRGDVSTRRVLNFEKVFEVFFRITHERDAIEFVVAAIGEDEEVAPAGVGKWRRN